MNLTTAARLIALANDPTQIAYATQWMREAFEAARSGLQEGGDPKAREIADHIDSTFGCHVEQVRKLVELMTGSPLPAPAGLGDRDRAGPVEMEVGAVLFGDHSGATSIVYHIDGDGDGYLMRANGEVCDCGYFEPAGTDWRVATEAEVDAFVAEFKATIAEQS